MEVLGEESKDKRLLNFRRYLQVQYMQYKSGIV